MIAFLDDQRRGRQGGAYERRVMAPISRRRIVSLLAPFHLDSRRLSPLTEQGPGWRRLTTVGGPAAPTSPDAPAAGRVHDDGDRFAPRAGPSHVEGDKPTGFEERGPARAFLARLDGSLTPNSI